MESLGSLDIFVRVGESRSFTAVGQQLGISASAVSKAIARLEDRLGTRLFHRSTRTVTLTPEGINFLERCRRILCELEQAQDELALSQSSPRGKLRVSLPSVGLLFMPQFARFNHQYPEVKLDIDCTDRLVDVIEEGFDAVIRIGEPKDSRLTSRKLGTYRRTMVASPAYLEAHGIPQSTEDLLHHRCLLYRYPSSGKIDVWPLSKNGEKVFPELPNSMVTNTLEPLLCFAESGLGIACLPDIAIRLQLEIRTLIPVLDEFNGDSTVLRVMWPSSKHLSPKLRVFIDFIVETLTLN
ncbi:LysR family transcriptional regulator [Pectobacterium odoriferum]|uniref:LysR family transcriptional regulator n=1 Tax=Pectobacterium odoriferum TaxID=78398 RepID=UPI00052A2D00|nr:LysR family transcriptional regulator [Pectobacterium odoriferum]GKW03845.1 LysR family transcriptional regulator [Pectobacterium carotovorum subsp. carotovorum]AIU87535.1 LysR family transcriptional regulator [Pectobacterium odoriferum]POE17594.1 LysR family transcriptional regulator [Pectobacterium odoriferum]POE35061.1 LysR family transcriptional regulator [Pectobacterium odoriferum]GKX43490.1 LysR family transcriptional regulator [Pectobacterium carotovorum subsp. carotovorum]